MTESQQRDMKMRAVSEDQRLAHRTATRIGARLRRYHAGTEEELPVNLLELLEALERAERRQ